MGKYIVKKYNLYFVILFIILSIILIIIIYKKYLKDDFERIFPPIDLPDNIINIVANTPLKPLSCK
jgi:hypothetical protein